MAMAWCHFNLANKNVLLHFYVWRVPLTYPTYINAINNKQTSYEIS